MPLFIEGGRVPSRWAEKRDCEISKKGHIRQSEFLSLALINNMPDPALEDTELQFFELLDIASGNLPIILKLYSLTGIPRTDRGQRHLNSFYFDFDDLWNATFDGVIVTGTEPHQPRLQDEPYWAILSELFEWAEMNTFSTVLSCLAAHASVLHGDGVNRHRLPDKQFGVFESMRTCDHALTSCIADRIRFPHSRWNEVRANELTSCGYSVLTESAEAGVDLFVKKKKKSLFVHFQGHPEYAAETLLKEYKRDIKRFLARERETFPTMPQGYFDEPATNALTAFRHNALQRRHEDCLSDFPAQMVANGLKNTWRSSAACLYRNWLQYVLSRKAEASAFSSLARTGHQRQAALNNEVA